MPHPHPPVQVGVDRDYWLLRWMRSNHIRSNKDLERFLSAPSGWRSVVDAVQAADEADERPLATTVATALLGQAYDLSPFDCFSPQHRLDAARPALSSGWLYFDTLVVQGLQPTRFLGLLRSKMLQSVALEMFRGYVRLILALERHGALKHIVFRPRLSGFAAYEGFGEGHAQALGLNLCMSRMFRNPQIDDLVERGHFECVAEREGVGSLYIFTHPQLDHEVPFEGGADHTLTKLGAAVNAYIERFCGRLADVRQARDFGVPLIARPDPLLGQPAVQSGWADPCACGSAVDVRGLPTSGQYLSALDLPFMAGVSFERVIGLRTEHSEEFDRFKAALIAALREQLDRTDQGNGFALSARVRDEYITPALADIDRRLRASRRAMSTKVAQNAAIGTVTSGVGLAAHLPLVLSAGIACTAASVAHINRLVDDKKDIELHDLFFLWRLARES